MAFNPLVIEPMVHLQMPPQYASPTHTGHYKLPSALKEAHRQDLPFSYLWKGICKFFYSILKPSEEGLWEPRARKTLNENMILQERLAEREESVERMERVLDGKLDRAANDVHEVLTAHVERTLVERVNEHEVFGDLLERHEVALSEERMCKRGYENIAGKYDALEVQLRIALQDKAEQVRRRDMFESTYLREKSHLAMYEKAWSEMSSVSNQSFRV